MATCFWTDGQRTLYHGDAREVCATLPADSFDSIVSDPPYGEQLVEGDDNPEFSANLLYEVLTAARHTLRSGGHVALFSSGRSVDLTINACRLAGLEFVKLLYMYNRQGGARPYRGWLPRVQPIVLARDSGRNFPTWREQSAAKIAAAAKTLGHTCSSLAKLLKVSDRLASKWLRPRDPAWSYPNETHRAKLEEILGISIPQAEVEPKLDARHDLYEVSSGRAETTHACEKPLAVVQDIIRRLGKSTLDPFCGSGTALVAARSLGIEAVGIEVDQEHCRRAVDRLEPKDLFSVAV